MWSVVQLHDGTATVYGPFASSEEADAWRALPWPTGEEKEGLFTAPLMQPERP